MSQLLPFAFYDDIDKQNRYKSQCENYSSNELLIQDGCVLLPFQIKSVDLSASATVLANMGIDLYKASDNSHVINLRGLTTNIDADLSLDKDVSFNDGITTITNSYFTYLGTIDMINSGDCVFDDFCEYYIVVTDSNGDFGTFYSEVFRVAKASEEFVKITFTNSSDFLTRALFQDGFTNTLYLNVDIKEPEYPITEDGNENGNREFIPSFVKWEKRYSFQTYLPEFLVDAITSLPLYDDINLTFKNDSTPTVIKDIEVSVDWQDIGETDKTSGCFASVTVGFAVDSIVVTPCSDDMIIT